MPSVPFMIYDPADVLECSSPAHPRQGAGAASTRRDEHSPASTLGWLTHARRPRQAFIRQVIKMADTHHGRAGRMSPLGHVDQTTTALVAVCQTRRLSCLATPVVL